MKKLLAIAIVVGSLVAAYGVFALTSSPSGSGGGGAASAVDATIVDGLTNEITLLNTDPVGTEYALPTRTVGSTTVVGTFGGLTAAGQPVNGNPVKIGGRANANEPSSTGIADGDAQWAWLDPRGRLVVIGGHANPEAPTTVNATASGDTTVIAAPGASVSLCIKKGSVHNRDASNRLVALTDGAAGTVRWRAEVTSEGGGSLFDFGDRGWCLTANTALVVNLDGVGSVDVNVTEYAIE